MTLEEIKEIVEQQCDALQVDPSKRVVLLRYFLWKKIRWMSMQKVAALTGARSHEVVRYSLKVVGRDAYRFTAATIEVAIDKAIEKNAHDLATNNQ